MLSECYMFRAYSEDHSIFREFCYLHKKRETLTCLKVSRIVDPKLEEVVVIPIQWDILLTRHIAGIRYDSR